MKHPNKLMVDQLGVLMNHALIHSENYLFESIKSNIEKFNILDQIVFFFQSKLEIEDLAKSKIGNINRTQFMEGLISEYKDEIIEFLQNAIDYKLALKYIQDKINFDYKNLEESFNNLDDSLFAFLNSGHNVFFSPNPPVPDPKTALMYFTYNCRITGSINYSLDYIVGNYLDWKSFKEMPNFEPEKYIDGICDRFLKDVVMGWVDADIMTNNIQKFGLPEDKFDGTLDIENPVFMALIQKYFLDGAQPLYNTIEMTNPRKAALIHFLRDKKTSANSILSNHLGRPTLSKPLKEKFDEIVKTINATTGSNISELSVKKKK